MLDDRLWGDLSDAFVGLTLPFYAGCLNTADYFPADSYLSIDVNDPEGAASIIRKAIANNQYEKRLAAIVEIRRRVLFDHNFFALVAREVEKRHRHGRGNETGQRIYRGMSSVA